MTGLTLGILFFALFICFFFIRRITRPLSALAEAAENLAENVEGGALELNLETAGRDEVGRLTTAINRLLDRIREYTQRLEKNAQEVARAHWQTKNSFEIIRKVWEQDNLRDVCKYMICKFQELAACNNLILCVFGSNKETLFAFFDGEIKTFKKENFEATLPLLTQLDGVTFVKKIAFDIGLVPNTFHSPSNVATFPIYHENQLLGALLIPCPGECKCNPKELEIINLVLNHSARALRRAVSHEEGMQDIRNQIDVTTEYCGIVGKDPKMQSIYKLIEDIALSDTTVLIQGESGTGKELVARAIHHKSIRRDNPFVVINCSAYPSTLLESELFGHEKGAFTGAIRQKTGRFEQAHGGTVFLDEIGEISASAQIKLLRVLQSQKFERIGGEKTLSVDVRVLAATNKNLIKEVKSGNFREDLYYRLNVIPIYLPPLKSRRNDITLQARYFMQRFVAEQNKDIKDISSEAMRRLLDYDWPGNVRELENCIEHAVVLARGRQIEVSDMPPALQQAKSKGLTETHGNTIVENESKLLQEALEDCDWNKKQAAQRLGISRNTLYRKLKKYKINPPTIH
jgi:two-component system response regulator HydG